MVNLSVRIKSKIAGGTKEYAHRMPPNPTNYFQGIIDEVAAFDDALSPEEI